MRTDKQITLLRQVARHVFGLSPQPPSGRPGDGTLARSGFPELREHLALPAAAAVQRLFRPADEVEVSVDAQSAGFSFPHMCCVCRGPVGRMLPLHPVIVSGWRGAQIASLEVPHCPQHGIIGVARLIAARVDFGAAIPAVWLVGRDTEYLACVAENLASGEPLPPWRVFPGQTPDGEIWQFGHGATWWRRAWQPFWEPLASEARDDYLRRWEAPDVWAAKLA